MPYSKLWVGIIAVFSISFFLLPVPSLGQGPTYHWGRTPTDKEIKDWDISVSPAGKELPPGSGTAKEGANIYAQKCAVCHGPTGEKWASTSGGGGRPLVGGRDTLNSADPLRTVGSFWPFATSVFDFIRRGMPQGQEGTLSANEVYALTAVLLYRNGIIKETDVLDAKSLPKVQMPNRNGFVPAEPKWKPGQPKKFGLYP